MPLASLHPTAARATSPHAVWPTKPRTLLGDRRRSVQDSGSLARQLPTLRNTSEGRPRRSARTSVSTTAALRRPREESMGRPEHPDGTRTLKFQSTPTFRLAQSAALAAKADPKTNERKTYTLVGAYPVETFEAWLSALVAGRRPPPQAQPAATKLPSGLVPRPPCAGPCSVRVHRGRRSHPGSPQCGGRSGRITPTSSAPTVEHMPHASSRRSTRSSSARATSGGCSRTSC